MGWKKKMGRYRVALCMIATLGSMGTARVPVNPASMPFMSSGSLMSNAV